MWVESDFDSDLDGKKDRLHADFTLPRETQTDGLKVPVIYEDSPYYAGTGGARNWLVDHELGATSTRLAQAFFNGTNTSPNISNAHEATWLPRGFAVVHSESPGSGYSDGCPTSGAPNETLGATAIIDWLNGRKKAYTTPRRHRRGRARELAQRQDGDDGHVLQRHDPDRRRVHRR